MSEEAPMMNRSEEPSKSQNDSEKAVHNDIKRFGGGVGRGVRMATMGAVGLGVVTASEVPQAEAGQVASHSYEQIQSREEGVRDFIRDNLENIATQIQAQLKVNNPNIVSAGPKMIYFVASQVAGELSEVVTKRTHSEVVNGRQETVTIKRGRYSGDDYKEAQRLIVQVYHTMLFTPEVSEVMNIAIGNFEINS